MSNTDRKARKAASHAAMLTRTGSLRNVRDLKKLKRLRDAERFQEHFKVGTPVLDRVEFQPRPIFGKGKDNPPTRHGVTYRTAHKLLSRGITADVLAAKEATA